MLGFLNKIKNLLTKHQDIGYVAIGNIVGNTIGSFFWIILAIIAPSEIYGKASYFLAIGAFTTSFVTFGLSTFVTTFLARGLKVHDEVASFVLIVSVTTAIVIFVIFQQLSLAILVIGSAFITVSTSSMIGRGNFKEYAICSIGQKILNIILSILLYYIMGTDGIIFGFAISQLIFGYRTLFLLRHFRLSFPILREKKNFLFHSWGLDVSKSLGFSIDKFLIAPLFGFAVLGVYQLGIQFLILQSIIPNVIMFPYLLREEARGINRRYVKIYGVMITIALSVIVVIVSPVLIPIVIPKYVGAIKLIQLVSWGAPLMALNSILSTELFAKNSKPVFISAIVFVIVVYVAMSSLGNVFGPIGLIYGMLIALTSETCCLFFYRHKNSSV